MNAFKKRRNSGSEAALETQVDQTVGHEEVAIDAAPGEPNAPAQQEQVATPEAGMPAHLERSLTLLTSKLDQCLKRLHTVEKRLDEMDEHWISAPSHSDLLEVRMHSAKLAAELARTTVELRGEIRLAGDETRRMALDALAASDDAKAAAAALTESDDEASTQEEKPDDGPRSLSVSA